MKDKIKKYFKERYKIILLIIVLCTVTVVSAAYDEEMTITGNGTIRVDEDIRVTNVKLIEKTGESYEQYNSRYSKDKTSMFVVLPSNTTITYEVEITNKDINNYYLKQIELENELEEGISYEILNYNIDNEELIEKNTTLKLKVEIKNTSNDTKTTNLILKYIFEHDSELPNWKVTGVENNNVLTTSIFNMEITGEDNYKGITSELSEKDIEFYVDGIQVNPIAIELTKKTPDETPNVYNLKVVMIGKEGNLTLKVKENTLKDKAGNYNNLNTIESNIQIEKNKETKIYMDQNAASWYLRIYIPKYYSEITISDSLNVEEIIDNNYDIVISEHSYSIVPQEVNKLFKEHINLLTQGNDNWDYNYSDNQLDIIKSNGYRGTSSALQVLAKKMINNNLTRYMSENLNELLEQQTLIKFKEEVEVLYQYEYDDQIYDLMGLYSKDNTNWLHIHSNNNFSPYYALMVEYVLGHLS